MSLATLSIDLVAKLAELQAGMDKAGRIAEKSAAQIEARYQALGAAAKGIGTALAAAFSATELVGFFRATVDGIDRLNDLSDATGASIENLSALEDIAARTGTSMETVESAVIKLNKALGDATAGTPMEAAFKALGLSVTQLKTLDPAEALRQVAVALSGYADDGNKARLVQELFGKSIKEVAPLLGDLAKAGQLNATVTAEQAKEAEKFNQQLAALEKNTTDAARAISGPLITALNDFFKYAPQASDASLTLAQRIEAIFKAAKSLGFGALLGLTNEEKTRLQQTKEELANIDKALARTNISDNWRADLVKLRAEKVAAIAEIEKSAAKAFRPSQNYGEAYKPSLPDVVGAPKTGKPAAAREPGMFVLELDDTTKAALKLLENTDSQKIAALRLQLQALIELDPNFSNPASVEAALSLEEQINAITARLPAETKPALDEISTFAEQAGRNIQDALGDSIVQTLSGNAASIGRIWTDMLKRMAAQAMAAQLGKYLLGPDFGKSGIIGGAIGSFFSGLSGARASGGPVSPGRAYLVGERGPEIVVPRGAGTVIPNGTGLAAAGGNTSFVVNVQGDASANTLRLINGALAQFEARMLMRAA